MQKDELKSLVTQMYDDLISTIDTQEDASKEQVVEYLRNATTSISNTDMNNADSVAHAKSMFANIYKEILQESLTSYSDTNSRFEELTQMQQETVSDLSLVHIDYPSIKLKFDEIQSHMSDEVQKANTIITQLTQQVQELETKSNLDALTKVFNRRALINYLSGICKKSTIHKELHLLILDVDDFKNINDTHGHIAGDKILIFIANILRKTLRDGDKVFRYGGEEFVITLNRIDTQKSYDVAQRILKLISSNHLIYKGETLQVTVSIGSTKYLKSDTPESLINRADKALYISKKNGKNQINIVGTDGTT